MLNQQDLASMSLEKEILGLGQLHCADTNRIVTTSTLDAPPPSSWTWSSRWSREVASDRRFGREVACDQRYGREVARTGGLLLGGLSIV